MRIRHYSFNSIESEILWFTSLGSTNDTAKELAESNRPEGTCVIADAQTSGRGRQGRSWDSPANQALYLSLILRPDINPEKLQLLTLVSAIATAETAGEFVQQSLIDIKWPNDLLIKGRKVSGILVESTFEGARVKYVVLGIGFNLNQIDFTDELRNHATSLKLQTETEYDREDFAVRLLKNIAHWYAILQSGSFHGILERWKTLSSFAENKMVTIDLGNEKINGITRGLTDNGALMIETESGIIPVNAGEIVNLRA
jgi:BirA family biotin operon repressor/biotin-[acetyl-CoA-carboxylase] ligase